MTTRDAKAAQKAHFFRQLGSSLDASDAIIKDRSVLSGGSRSAGVFEYLASILLACRFELNVDEATVFDRCSSGPERQKLDDTRLIFDRSRCTGVSFTGSKSWRIAVSYWRSPMSRGVALSQTLRLPFSRSECCLPSNKRPWTSMEEFLDTWACCRVFDTGPLVYRSDSGHRCGRTSRACELGL